VNVCLGVCVWVCCVCVSVCVGVCECVFSVSVCGYVWCVVCVCVCVVVPTILHPTMCSSTFISGVFKTVFVSVIKKWVGSGA